MVDENQTQELETAVDETVAQMPTAEELMERMNKLESTNERLLTESKDWKAKAQGLRLENENKEKLELESKESWQELLERERDDKHKLAEDFKALKKQTVQKQIHFEVAKLASDAHSLDDVIRILPTELLNVDEDTLSISGIAESIESMRKDRGYMFKPVNSPSMVNNRPDSMTTERSLEQLSRAERHELVLKNH